MTEVASESDARTANNAVRHTYRILSDAEKASMVALKDKGLEFIDLLHSIGKTAPVEGSHLASRELSLAGTKIEEAVMWAVKHITR